MQQIILLTGNWNEAGAASLEATIQASHTFTSLPVLTIHVIDFFSHPRRRVVWSPPESLNSLQSLAKTMRCDKFSGPGSISLNKGGNRWLGVVEAQIEAGALVQRVEDAMQGDLRFIIARQQGEDKGRDWLM
jgi:hypothetical protein